MLYVHTLVNTRSSLTPLVGQARVSLALVCNYSQGRLNCAVNEHPMMPHCASVQFPLAPIFVLLIPPCILHRLNYFHKMTDSSVFSILYRWTLYTMDTTRIPTWIKQQFMGKTHCVRYTQTHTSCTSANCMCESHVVPMLYGWMLCMLSWCRRGSLLRCWYWANWL